MKLPRGKDLRLASTMRVTLAAHRTQVSALDGGVNIDNAPDVVVRDYLHLVRSLIEATSARISGRAAAAALRGVF